MGDLLERIVRHLDTNLSVPVTVKMRLVNTDCLQETIALASALEAAGASVICLHGRTKEMKGQNTGPCNWDAIAAVKQRVGVPLIANGGIETYKDALRCMEATGCDAVMSSEAEEEILVYLVLRVHLESREKGTSRYWRPSTTSWRKW